MPKTPEKNLQNIPAIEVAGKKCHILDQTIDIGPHYEKLHKLRKIREQEFTLDMHTLEVLKSLVRGVNLKAPTLLEGPTAASKTSAVEYLALLSGHTHHRINLKGQTDSSEMLGKFVPNPAAKAGEVPLMWQDGLLVKAMKEGHWVILDELNLAEPQILESINSVLEKYPSITLTDNGGVKVGPGGDYEVHPNFRIFATMNPGYTGRQPLSPAFQNRWTNRVHVGAPNREQLEAMLGHHTFGIQPKVTYQGEVYENEPGEILDQMEKIKSLDKTSVLTLFSRLAAFHEAISKMAEKQDIGRDQDPGHVFTRRDLSTFLDYITTSENHSRHKRETQNITTHPVLIILEAIKLVYLDKLGNSDDRKKVETLLKTSKLDTAALKELFEVKTITTTTASKAAAAAAKPAETAPEVKEIQADLEKDYQKSIETLQYFGTKDETGEFTSLLQEDAENPGTYFYEADYDGSAETIPDPADSTSRIPNPTAANFTGHRFTMPTLPEVLSWLSAEQIKIYKEMKEKGLEPKLQLTPIAKSIRSLAKSVADKREGPGGLEEILGKKLQADTVYVWDDIKDHELVYDASGFKAIDDGKKLQVTGGKSKSQLINENKGWIIDFVATKQNIDADEDKKTKKVGAKDIELTNAEKTEKYLQDYPEQGLGYEAYLLAQMEALRSGNPLEKATWTILPGSSLTDQNIIAYGYWDDDYVRLHRVLAGHQLDNLRFRRSVRVKTLKI